MEEDEFPTVAALVRYIRERTHEIAKAIIIPPELAFIESGVEVLPACEDYTLFIRVAGGNPIVVGQWAAQAVLNDGILNRMHIPIELWMGPLAEDQLPIADEVEVELASESARTSRPRSSIFFLRKP